MIIVFDSTDMVIPTCMTTVNKLCAKFFTTCGVFKSKAHHTTPRHAHITLINNTLSQQNKILQILG